MTQARHQRIRELFDAALGVEADRREAWLREACGGDDELAGEVGSLLAAHGDADQFLEPSSGPAGRVVADPLIGTRVGPYQLVSRLGRGGMGAVYVGLRADDSYHRRVAVKLIRAGMDVGAVLERFRHERQILGALHHPNIATLIDGGSTEDGWPFLVMEYVEGESLDRYCHKQGLSIAERVRLFRTICDAVSYAHRNLVVHRDLKPGNILVTPEGVPKLLDFGIAKVLNPDLTGLPGTPTVTAFRMMTPEYASPEQLRGDPITTASDVYSLGVLLYELLTGARPHRLGGKSHGEIAKIVSESEPRRPSEVLAPTRPAEPRAGDPGGGLDGDLDAIVMMALRKEPNHRYASVDQLSDDLALYLDHRPVRARRGTWRYYAGKFVRRNQVAVAAAAVVMLVLGGGVLATSWQARRAERERAKAERLLIDVRQLTNAFLFDVHDAIERLPGSTPARELVVTRALGYLDRLAAESSEDATLQLELAAGYARLGNIQWSRYYAHLGDLAGALASQRKALAIREEVAARDDADHDARRALGYSLVAVGDALHGAGGLDSARRTYERALALREDLVASDPASLADQRDLAVSQQRLGDILGNPGMANLGDFDGALAAFRKMQDIFERLAADPRATPGDRHSVGIGYEKLGRVMDARGQRDDALAYYRLELDAFRADLAADPNDAQLERDLAVAYGNVGDALAGMGRYDEALEVYRDGLAIRRSLVERDPRNMGAVRDLAFMERAIAWALGGKGQTARALEAVRRAVREIERAYSADPTNQFLRSQLAGTLDRAAQLAADGGRARDARELASRSLAVLKSAADRSDASAIELNAYAWMALTHPVEAVRQTRAALRYAERAVERSGGNDPNLLDTLAHAYLANGRRDEAIATAESALALVPSDAPERGDYEATLARFRGS
ncbi:MAG: protein kinase [Gemmatimonadales bacterium]